MLVRCLRHYRRSRGACKAASSSPNVAIGETQTRAFSSICRALAHLATALAALLVCAIAFGAAAHEIPNDVKIIAFFKPAGDRAYLLMRVPLAAMVEVEYPTRGPGYLDLPRADDALRGAIKLYLTDNIRSLKTANRFQARASPIFCVSLPSDKSFGSYESALAHVQGAPLPAGMDLYWNQQFIDVLLEYPIQSDRSEFAIQPARRPVRPDGHDNASLPDTRRRNAGI